MHIELHHIGITVGQVDEILDALREAFGAERLPEPAAGHMLVRLGALELALVERKDTDPSERAFGDHLAFTLSAAERDEAVRRLKERGWPAEEVRGRIYVQSPDASLTLELLAM
jgi:hypothetical protein